MKSLFKHAVVAFSVAVISLVGVIDEAQAARLGGKKSSGMQRTTQQTTPNSAQNPTANTPARNPQANASTPNNAQKPSAARRWMGPLVGIASALGIVALLSHFGLGEGFASMVTLLLMVWLGFMLLRMALNLFRAKQPQAAGAHGYNRSAEPSARSSSPFATDTGSTAQTQVTSTASHVNQDEFLRIAKSFFIRLQAANDKKDLDDLRRFLTPEMFAEIKMGIDERKGAKQTTDVAQLNAEVLDVAEEAGRYIVSVHFNGLIREEDGAAAQPFAEVWHMAKPRDGSRGWVLAGIQQVQ